MLAFFASGSTRKVSEKNEISPKGGHMKITAAKVKQLRAPKSGQVIYRDDEIKGFAVRVTAGGEKAFVWEGRIKGRVRRITIANVEDMSVMAARRWAYEVRASVARGEDPASDRQVQKQEATFKSLVDAFLELHAKPHRKTWQRDAQRFAVHFGRWNNRRASDISPEDVAKAQIEIARQHGKVASNRACSLLRQLFAWAKENRRFVHENPVAGLKFFKEESRKRFLAPDELARVNQALADEPDWRFRAFFALDLMIGARKSNLLAARWADIDLVNAVWHIPETKNGESLSVPLPAPAVSLLEALPSRGKGEWVFPSEGRSRSKSGHLMEPSRAWDRIRRRAGVSDVTVHDLRRTVGAMLAAAGMSGFVIKAALGHKSIRATEIYARLNLDPVRQALERTSAMVAIPAVTRIDAGDAIEV
jgi:integrase